MNDPEIYAIIEELMTIFEDHNYQIINPTPDVDLENVNKTIVVFMKIDSSKPHKK